MSFQRWNYFWKNSSAWSQIASFSEKREGEVDSSATDSSSPTAGDTQKSSIIDDHAQDAAVNMSPLSEQNLESTNDSSDKETNVRVAPAIKAMEKFEMLLKERTVESENVKSSDDRNNNESFHQLLRKSRFMQLGDISKLAFKGKIVRIVDDDMYIDFGGKFNCVCKRPTTQYQKFYKVGATVRLQVKDFEMTSSFLGSSKHLTLEEADAVLLGLFNPPKRRSEDLIEY